MSLRAWRRLAAAGLLLAVCLPGWWIGRLFGRGSFWVKTFLFGTGWLLGVRVRTVGRALPGPVLYVANHLTFLDILALGGATPARFVAKAQIAGWGFAGFLARVGGTLFVSRERRSETRGQADLLATALAGRRPIVLFGEGQTGDGITLLPFRPALFTAAIEAGVPVQPVAIDYAGDRSALSWPDETDFATETRKLMNRAERIPVTLHFLPPLDPRTLDRKALAARSYAAIAAALASAS